jgi:hypothetical protein
MTKNEFNELVAHTLGDLMETLKKKQNDYTGGGDPFANFRLSTLEGVEPTTGLMIRVQDKMQRIRTYLKKGELFVDGEGFEDAIEDVIGYMLILKGLLREQATIHYVDTIVDLDRDDMGVL